MHYLNNIFKKPIKLVKSTRIKLASEYVSVGVSGMFLHFGVTLDFIVTTNTTTFSSITVINTVSTLSTSVIFTIFASQCGSSNICSGSTCLWWRTSG